MVFCRSSGNESAIRDTVDAASVVCTRREHQVAGLGRRQRNPHRLGIAHLADDDDVGRLAQRGAQRGREVGRVDADLHLLDDAAVCWCSYSIGSSMVTMCRASRRLISSTSAASVVVLPDAGGAADEDQAARQLRERSTPGRQVQRRRGAARAAGSARIAAAARPRSRCRLMRNRPSPCTRNDASAIRRLAIDAPGVRRPAPAAPPPRCRRRRAAPSRRAGGPRPSTRIDGGAPATSSRFAGAEAAGAGQPPFQVRRRRGGGSSPLTRAFSSSTARSKSDMAHPFQQSAPQQRQDGLPRIGKSLTDRYRAEPSRSRR